MITFLETVGPAIWRASWQGAVLALVVAGLVWCCGERLSPRWRFLLWSVVLMRLLIVVTPTSPWSVFNPECKRIPGTVTSGGRRGDG